MCIMQSTRLIDFRHWALFIVQGTSKGQRELEELQNELLTEL